MEASSWDVTNSRSQAGTSKSCSHLIINTFFPKLGLKTLPTHFTQPNPPSPLLYVFVSPFRWEVVEAAAGAPSLSGASIPVGTTGPQLVRALLERGSAMGLNVMRTWAHAVNPQYALQTAPGVYNEATFQGLDYMIDQARVHGVKLILAFTSNWTPTGGIPEYVKWAGLTENTAFFTSPEVKNMYKEFVTAIVNRVNTINGRVYRDDPTIMAWNLLNGKPLLF